MEKSTLYEISSFSFVFANFLPVLFSEMTQKLRRDTEQKQEKTEDNAEVNESIAFFLLTGGKRCGTIYKRSIVRI